MAISGWDVGSLADEQESSARSWFGPLHGTTLLAQSSRPDTPGRILGAGSERTPEHQLQLKDGCPVVELEGGLCFLLAPIINFQFLIAFVTELKVVVIGPPLQCRQCCCCNLMCPPGSTVMRCPQEESTVPALVISV